LRRPATSDQPDERESVGSKHKRLGGELAAERRGSSGTGTRLSFFGLEDDDLTPLGLGQTGQRMDV